MSNRSKIEWTDVTWNPIRGCSVLTDECVRCYAMRQAHRQSAPGKAYHGLTKRGPQGPIWTGKTSFDAKTLAEPLGWKKPRLCFPCSMSDLFHEANPFEWIAAVYGVMIATRHIRYQVTTKRPERAKAFFDWIDTFHDPDFEDDMRPARCIAYARDAMAPGDRKRLNRLLHARFAWPPPNVLGMVSAGRQKYLDDRVPKLLELPFALKAVSLEPLLESVKLPGLHCPGCGYTRRDALTIGDHYPRYCRAASQSEPWRFGLDWIVVGGESGPGARECQIRWIRSVVDQATKALVPVFVKQMGAKPVRIELRNDHERQRELVELGRVDDPLGRGGAPMATKEVRFELQLADSKGGDWNEWTTTLELDDLKVREHPDWPRPT